MRSESPDRRQRNKRLLIITAIIIAFIIGTAFFIYSGYRFNWVWTGFNASIGPNMEQFQPTKTLWDWMQLLIVPVVLFVAAFLLNFALSQNEKKETKQRAETEHEIALDNQRETLLQGYLDRMADLLLSNHLRDPDRNATEVRHIARARTLMALFGLDSIRKGSLIRFLYESSLITCDTDTRKSIIDLSDANLIGADLTRANLIGANLCKADLSGALLSFARLDEANLEGAKLSEANLTGANLSGTNLINAKLGGAKLRAANLKRAHLNDGDLRRADLYWANLSRADLSGANLGRLDLTDVTFDEVIVTDETNLDGTLLSTEQKESIKRIKNGSL